MMEQREPWVATGFIDALDRVDAAASALVRIPIAVPGREPEGRGVAASRADLMLVGGTDMLLESYVRDVDHAQQLANDVDEIAQARDALLISSPAATTPQTKEGERALPLLPATPQRIVWLPTTLSRTADSVPIILGSTLGFLMILVFTTAAVFVKLAR